MEFTYSNFKRIPEFSTFRSYVCEAFTYNTIFNGLICKKGEQLVLRIEQTSNIKWVQIAVDKHYNEMDDDGMPDLCYGGESKIRLDDCYTQLIEKEQMILLVAKINLFEEYGIQDIITHIKSIIRDLISH